MIGCQKRIVIHDVWSEKYSEFLGSVERTHHEGSSLVMHMVAYVTAKRLADHFFIPPSQLNFLDLRYFLNIVSQKYLAAARKIISLYQSLPVFRFWQHFFAN